MSDSNPILWEGCPSHFHYVLVILPTVGFGILILFLTIGLSIKIFTHFPPVSYSPGANNNVFILLCFIALFVGGWNSIRFIIVEPYRRWSEWHGIKYQLTDKEVLITKSGTTTIIPFSQINQIINHPCFLGKSKNIGSLFFKRKAEEVLPVGLNIAPSSRPFIRAVGFECIENVDSIASIVKKIRQ